MRDFSKSRRFPVMGDSWVLVSAVALLSLAGCSDAATDEGNGDGDGDASACSPGQLGCSCMEGNLCSGSLLCSAGVCTDAAAGTGGISAGTGGAGTGGLGTGGATGGTVGSGGGATGGATGSGGGPGSGGMSAGGFTITSAELSEGGEFLPKHTCEMAGFDNDESPPLSWSGIPDGTMSLVITFIDRTLIDDDSDLGYHWAIWGLDPSVMSLPANLPAGMNLTTPVNATQSRNSYLGPCPAYGQTMAPEEPHYYEFTIWALPTADAGISGMLDETMYDTLEAAALDSATLTGLSYAYSPF